MPRPPTASAPAGEVRNHISTVVAKSHVADRGMIAVEVTIAVLPVVLPYRLLQYRFSEGITAGAPQR